jgi:hypothetical protein
MFYWPSNHKFLWVALTLCALWSVTPGLWANQGQSPAPAKLAFRLEDSTPIKLRLQRTLSSADAHVDDRVDFDVLEEIRVNDVLVIPKGSVAWGTVTEAQSKRRMARGGKLNVNIDAVRLADGEKCPLRAVREVKGGGHTGAMTAGIVATGLLVWPAAPFFLFMHGKDIVIAKGTEITAYINGDMNLDPAKFAPKPASEAQALPAPPTATAESTTVLVKSMPDGADITVDGKYMGSTPSSLRLAAGDHSVSVEKSGFKKWQRTMTVSAGSSIMLDATLEAAQSTSVAQVPAGPANPVMQPPAPTQIAPFGVAGHATDEGFEVTSVSEGSPAARIFLRPGDVISKIDDRWIKSDQDISSAVAESASGTVKVTGLTQTAVGKVRFEREVKVR